MFSCVHSNDTQRVSTQNAGGTGLVERGSKRQDGPDKRLQTCSHTRPASSTAGGCHQLPMELVPSGLSTCCSPALKANNSTAASRTNTNELILLLPCLQGWYCALPLPIGQTLCVHQKAERYVQVLVDSAEASVSKDNILLGSCSGKAGVVHGRVAAYSVTCEKTLPHNMTECTQKPDKSWKSVGAYHQPLQRGSLAHILAVAFAIRPFHFLQLSHGVQYIWICKAVSMSHNQLGTDTLFLSSTQQRGRTHETGA